MFKRYWWILLVMAPIGMLAGFMLAAVVTYVMPKKYESSTTIEVKPPARTLRPSTLTPQFFGTEFERIKSRASLTKVSDSLQLTQKWGVDEEQVVRILKGIVNTQNIRGTDLISITVRHTNKEDARNIAVSVAKSYKEYRAELEEKWSEKAFSELKKTVNEQEEKVEELRKVLTTIVQSIEADQQSDEFLEKTEEAKREFDTEQSLLDQMKLKAIEVEIDRKIVQETVIVHENPVISDSPVSPNVTVNLVLGPIIGLLLSPFFALPLMWLLNRRTPA